MNSCWYLLDVSRFYVLYLAAPIRKFIAWCHEGDTNLVFAGPPLHFDFLVISPDVAGAPSQITIEIGLIPFSLLETTVGQGIATVRIPPKYGCRRLSNEGQHQMQVMKRPNSPPQQEERAG